MSEFKGTPGTWRVARQNGSPTTGEWMIAGEKPGYLAEVRDCGGGFAAANARLLASSPVLLEALQAAVASFDEWAEDADPPSLADAKERLAWVDQARAAISLALGE